MFFREPNLEERSELLLPNLLVLNMERKLVKQLEPKLVEMLERRLPLSMLKRSHWRFPERR